MSGDKSYPWNSLIGKMQSFKNLYKVSNPVLSSVFAQAQDRMDEDSATIATLTRRVEELEGESTWLPIETAPATHGGPTVDLWATGERYTDCMWGRPTYGGQKGVYGWVYQSGYDCDGPVHDWVPSPSHWRPLPTPPKGEDHG